MAELKVRSTTVVAVNRTLPNFVSKAEPSESRELTLLFVLLKNKRLLVVIYQ